MRAFIILSMVAAATANGGYSGGGGSGGGFAGAIGVLSGGSGIGNSRGSFGNFGAGGGVGTFGGGAGSEGAGGQIFRHVYVHSAPDEPLDSSARTIRVPGGGDKHVNIIFVKTPSQSSQQQTEVILPEQDEQKNLVYVLLKKGEANSDVRIRRPAARGPTKPEVYFIRYKDQAAGGAGTAGGSGFATGGGAIATFGGGNAGFSSGGALSTAYGAP